MTIGILKEGKKPADARVPLSPAQCRLLTGKYPFLKIKVQASDARCFSDDEYAKAGINIVTDVTDCDILLGVKEVPVDWLIPGKTFLFFSHTIKAQPYNRGLLQAVIQKKIRLVDYECLTDNKGIRVIAFGRWAGIVGAHNGLFTWGKKTGRLILNRVNQHHDFAALKQYYEKIKIPPLRIIIAGDGRVANGAVEIMELLRIKRIAPEEYLRNAYDGEAVYTQLSPKDIYVHQSGKPFDLQEFFKKPGEFNCDFKNWYDKTDLMINAIYWDPKAPRYFSLEEMKSPDFKIKTIADISCDINGSVPATLRATTIADPVMGYDPFTKKETQPFQAHPVDIMAVDNLPNELPRDASESFGQQLVDKVLDELLFEKGNMIKRATIAENGKLGERFVYLQNYLEGK